MRTLIGFCAWAIAVSLGSAADPTVTGEPGQPIEVASPFANQSPTSTVYYSPDSGLFLWPARQLPSPGASTVCIAPAAGTYRVVVAASVGGQVVTSQVTVTVAAAKRVAYGPISTDTYPPSSQLPSMPDGTAAIRAYVDTLPHQEILYLPYYTSPSLPVSYSGGILSVCPGGACRGR